MRRASYCEAKVVGVDVSKFGAAIGSTFLPVVQSFVQACNDFSVSGIKSFHEQKAAAEKAQLDRDKTITDNRKKREEQLAAERKAKADAIKQREAEVSVSSVREWRDMCRSEPRRRLRRRGSESVRSLSRKVRPSLSSRGSPELTI